MSVLKSHNSWLKNHPESTDYPIATRQIDNYTLQKVVMFSRHNIRAPFATAKTSFNYLSSKQWLKFSSENAYLTMKGGILETLMGQYFRKYFQFHRLFSENEQPTDVDVRFYANSLQRTVATAKFLSSGIFPTANVPVEFHHSIGNDDAVFFDVLPQLPTKTKEQLFNDIKQLSHDNTIEHLLHHVKDNYALLERVIDFKASPYARDNQLDAFDLNDITLSFEAGEYPNVHGSLHTGLNASDALVLQYYEMTDTLKASFNTPLTFEQWRQIAQIKDLYCDVVFTTQTLGTILTRKIAQTLSDEMTNEDRRLSVLVGHDINIGGLLNAIGAFDYQLPYSIEEKTPIGSKIVIEKWVSKQGEAFASVQLVYFSVDQMRYALQLDLDNPPMRFDLSIKTLEKNSDGLYRYDDVVQLLQQTANKGNALIACDEC